MHEFLDDHRPHAAEDAWIAAGTRAVIRRKRHWKLSLDRLIEGVRRCRGDPLASRLLEMDLLGREQPSLNESTPREALRGQSPFEITLQRRYNPEGITQYNIVPGLLGVVLTMMMMMFTALAVTREIERGTMESLLSMPINRLRS
jgi:ABC-2 family transporter protein